MSGKKRNYSFSYIRVIACFSVIILHTANASAILFKNSISTRQLGCSMGTVYGMMFAVPCFLMVTGALLLDPKRRISNKRLIGHYVLKALEPLIVLGFLFEIFDELADGQQLGAHTVKNAVMAIITGHSWSHLWYLYLLLGIYILLPIYRVIAINCNKNLLRYLICVYLIFQSLIPITRVWGISCATVIQVTGIYVFYLFAGFAITQGIIKINRIMGTGLFIVGLAGTVVLTVCRYLYSVESLDIILGSYASPFVIMQAVGFFTIVYHEGVKEYEETKIKERVLEFLDDNSFGVYLLHMVFVRIILRYQGVNPYEHGMVFFALLVLFIFVVSTLVTFLVRFPVKNIRHFMRGEYWRIVACNQEKQEAK